MDARAYPLVDSHTVTHTLSLVASLLPALAVSGGEGECWREGTRHLLGCVESLNLLVTRLLGTHSGLMYGVAHYLSLLGVKYVSTVDQLVQISSGSGESQAHITGQSTGILTHLSTRLTVPHLSEIHSPAYTRLRSW